MSEDGFTLDFDTSEFEAALDALPKRLQSQYLKESMQAAGDVILAAMKELAPERTDGDTPDSNSLPPGYLRADLDTSVIVTGSKNPTVLVGASPLTAHVARWINNGWTLTGHGKKHSRRQIRQIQGKHFMEGAFDESADKAISVLIEKLGSLLNQDLGEGGADTNYSGENY